MTEFAGAFEDDVKQDNPFSGAFEEPKAGINIQDSIGSNPEQAAKSTSLSKRYGVTPNVVSAFESDYDARAKTEDSMAVVDRSPKLRDWLSVDPNNAKLSHPDIPRLGATERTFKEWLTDPIASLASGGNSMLSMGAFLLNIASKYDPNAMQRKLASAVSGVDTGFEQNQLYASIQSTLSEQRQSIESFKSAKLQEQNQNVQNAKGVGGVLSALYENPLSAADFITQQAPQLGVTGKAMQLASKGTQGAELLGRAAAANVGINAAMGAADAGTQAEQSVRAMSYDQLNESSDHFRELVEGGASPESAKEQLAQNAGQVSALIAAPISGVLSRLGSGVESKFISQLMGEHATDITLRGALKQFLPTLGKEVAEESLDEGATQAASNIGVKLTADENQSIGEGVTEAATLGGALGVAFSTAPNLSNVTVGYINDSLKASAAETEKNKFLALNEIAKETGMVNHSPEEYEQLIGEQAVDTSAENVYFDGKMLMQSEIGEKAVELSPAIAEQIKLAAETGSLIRVPMSEYMTKLAPSEIADQLADHVKTDVNGFSAFEATEYKKTESERLQADIQRSIDEASADDAFKQSQKAVENDIKSQLSTTERFSPKVMGSYAQLASSYYASRAAALGTTPEKLYQDNKLGITDLSATGDVLSQKLDFTVERSEEPITENIVMGGVGEESTSNAAPREEYVARNSNGDVIGTAAFTPNEDGTHFAEHVQVDKDFRRKGVATELYRQAQADGLNVVPSKQQSKEGKALTDAILSNRKDDQTETNEFKNWFGDSKVVDESGKPLVVYHGTSSDFGSFSKVRRGASTGEESAKAGFWFIDDAETASNYADLASDEPVKKLQSKIDAAERKGKWDEVDKLTLEMEELALTNEKGQNILPVYLSAKKPFIFEAGGESFMDLQGEINDYIKIAKDGGYDSIIFTDLVDDPNGVTRSAKHILVFEPSQIKSATGNNGNFDPNDPNILNQDGESARGFYDPSKSLIGLLKNADLSTFLHESGHFFFDSDIKLASSLLSKTGLSEGEQSIVNDVSAVLDWHGLKGDIASQIDQWNSLDFEQQRIMHERTAESFEHYLFTGKAPSLELQKAFSNFARWLKSVYRSIKDFLAKNPEAGKLNDEVRAIFDRMLATQEQIAAAESARSMSPLIANMADAEKVGMTAEQFSNIHFMNADATNEAVDKLQTKSLQDLQWLHNARNKEIKKLQREHKSARAEQREIVKEQVMQEPIYQAWTYLTAKENGGKIDSSVLGEYGLYETRLKRIRDYKMASKEGISPDVIADKFGFTSADEFLSSLTSVEKPNDRIDQLTDERMLQEYGNLATQEDLEREADKAVHNKLRLKVLGAEHDALAKAVGGKRIVTSVAKEFADRLIGGTEIRNIRPAQFSAQEVKSARAAETAFRKGDIKTAAIEKRNQIIHSQTAEAAYDARDEIVKDVRYLKRIQKSQKTMRGEALVQLNALLARFDLRTLTNKQIDDDKTPLAQWVNDESERLEAIAPDLPDFILNESYRKHYRDMTMDEFRSLVDSVKQLELLARREDKQYKAIRDQSFYDERTSLLDAIRTNFSDAFNEDGSPKDIEHEAVKSLTKKIGEAGQAFNGEFLGPENLVKLLSAGKFDAVQESLFSRMSHASDDKVDRLSDIYKNIKDELNAYTIPEKLAFSRKGILIPEIGRALTRENIVMVALYNGSPEGRDRLKNYGWSESQVQAIVNHLNEKDINLIEKIWDTFDNKMWPELKALNERTMGRSPPKTKAVPYTVNGRRMSGGYMMLSYDKNLDERANRYDEVNAAKALIGGTMGMAAKTKQSTSKERLASVSMRPRLDFGVFSDAVNETTHDLAFREAVADTMRVLKDERVMKAIKQAIGIPAYRALVKNVRDSAAPPSIPSGFLDKMLNIARKNTVVNLMSGVKTALQNFTGIAPAMAKVNPALIMKEVGNYTRHPKKYTQFALENSSFMRHRITSYDRDLSEMAKKLTVKGSILPSQSFYLGLMSQVDRMVTVPVWTAAYKDGMSKFDNDSDKAVDYADHIIRTTQGSGREVDLAQVMSGAGALGSLKKVFTMFYSYFNGQLALLVTEGAIGKREAKENPSLAVAKYTAKFMAIVAAPVILTELLMRGLPDDDDDEDRWSKAFLSYGFAMIPFFRDVAAFAMAKYDPNSKYHGNFKLSPIQSSIETAVQAPESIYNLWTGDASAYDEKQAIMGTSFLLGLPGKLISDTVMGFQAWMDGESGPEAIVLGPPKK